MLKNDTLIRALLRQPTPYTPIWIMRQAGKPKMDIQLILKGLTDSKELVADVMDELKRKKTGAT